MRRALVSLAGVAAIAVLLGIGTGKLPNPWTSPKAVPSLVGPEAHHDLSAPFALMTSAVDPAIGGGGDPGAGPSVKGGDDPAEVAREASYPRPKVEAGVLDPVVQRSAFGPVRAMPTSSASFNGIGATNYAPPDTSMDVSPTQIVETVNVRLAVYSKTGTVLKAPVLTNTLWSGFGGLCETSNSGDATVQWDRIANRWVVSQFAVGGGANGTTIPYLQCVAVSTTADATGTWYRYSFPYSFFPDYPKLAVWPDAYYTTFNGFNSNNTFYGGVVCAYERAAMLTGASARQVCFNNPSYGGILVAGIEGATPPAAGTAAWATALQSSTTTAVWRFHVDWANTANSTWSAQTAAAVAGWVTACSAYTRGACVAQPATTQLLETLNDRQMYRLVYRNRGGTESILMSQTVDNGGPTAVRWYELRPSGSTLAVFQQGTYAPDVTSRFMPSIAMDGAGDIALGYSLSSSSVRPSVGYAGRLAGDPAGQLTQGESVLNAGTGSQTGGLARWGDYSALVVDPADDCTFWIANQFQPADGSFNWATRIGSFVFPACGGAPTLTAPVVTAHPSNATVNAGGNATFIAAATGNPAPTVQWQVSTDSGTTWSDIAGAATATYTFLTAAGDNGRQYRAVFTNSQGSATTTAATLIVNTVPVVTVNPSSLTLSAGATASFTAAATGTPTPTVYWQVSTSGGSFWTSVPGAVSPTYAFTAAGTDDGKQFRAVFANSAGSATTSAAALTVNSAPVITANPANVMVTAGAIASFSAAASGSPASTVQWQASADGGSTWNAVAGATATTYAFTTTAADNGRQFRAVFTNTNGTGTSTAATLSVNVAPQVVANPASISVIAGALASFSAGAAGTPTPIVSWQVSTDSGATWTGIVGASSTTYSFATVAGDNGKRFRALFTNTAGSATTSAATLTVTVAGLPSVASYSPAISRSGVATVVTLTGTNLTGTTLVTLNGVALGTPTVVSATSVRVTLPTSGLTSGPLRATTPAGTSTNTTVFTIANAAPVAVSAGASHSCAVLADGTARCWGLNTNGRLGDGTTTQRTGPVTVLASAGVPLTGVTAIAAGGSSTCALLSSGAVRCWGNNANGQLGNGTTTSSSYPVAVTGITTATAITVGSGHACAILGTGATATARCWGVNTNGRLGDGTSTQRPSPVTVLASAGTTLTGVTRISAGASSTCAVLSTGAARCWGLNTNGQLGNGTTTSSAYPVAVSGITTATGIGVGSGFACAVIGSGTTATARCWGINSSRQLADGTTTQRLTPVTVHATSTTNLTNLSGITTGNGHACVIVGAGSTATARCWGSDASGQVGNGAAAAPTYPATPAGTTGITSISAGGSHTVAVVPSTAIPPRGGIAWGLNTNGQLGDGTTTSKTSPVTLTAL